MKKTQKGSDLKRDRATFEENSKELYSHSQFVDFQRGPNPLDPMKYLNKKDTFPVAASEQEITPLGSFAGLPPFNPAMLSGPNSHHHFDFAPPTSSAARLPDFAQFSASSDELSAQVAYLTDSLNHEIATNKLLEQKCEEYLAQLQRSADIIENTRQKHDLQTENLMDKLENAESQLASAQEKVQQLESELDRLDRDLRRERAERESEVGETVATKEVLQRKDQAALELRARLSELEGELAGLRSEQALLKADKHRLEDERDGLRRDLDRADKELRLKEQDIRRFEHKEDGGRSQLGQLTERVAELKEENAGLRQDKEKLFNKVDHLLYENENLRNEVFMLKKIMLEVEKRDARLGASFAADPASFLQAPRPWSREEEPERARPDRPRYSALTSRSPITQARENFGVREGAPKYSTADGFPGPARPYYQQGSNPRLESGQRPLAALPQNGPPVDRSSTRQSGLFNKGSQQSDIITWDNPYQCSRGSPSEDAAGPRGAG
jgi:hypothetical protein